ncbi:MAG: glycosyltransferase family 4 protein [Chlamydiales bacterium]
MNSIKSSFLCPYNEILPRKKAHDLFLFQECDALARAGFDVSLLCGKGSLPDDALFSYYLGKNSSSFTIDRLPIIRKNNFLNLSWNRPFFFFTQRKIVEKRPDFVLLSVLKQADYHVRHKVPGVKYIYEAHEVSTYPNEPLSSRCIQEKKMLSRCDLVVVTTDELKNILYNTPYNLSVPVAVIPLAVEKTPMKPLPFSLPFVLTYVGQLYKGQGVEQLLETARKFPQIQLQIIGGTKEEIKRLHPLHRRAHFFGYCPPTEVTEIAQTSHAFVAPFALTGRMPYVAHTKLYEYSAWQRPFLAPDIPLVRSHFPHALLFTNLEESLRQIMQPEVYARLAKGPFFSYTWKERANKYRSLLIT